MSPVVQLCVVDVDHITGGIVDDYRIHRIWNHRLGVVWNGLVYNCYNCHIDGRGNDDWHQYALLRIVGVVHVAWIAVDAIAILLVTL